MVPGRETTEARHLGAFTKYQTITAAVGAALVFSLGGIYNSHGLLLLGLVITAHLGSLLWVRHQIAQGRVQRAAVAICVGVWTIAVFVGYFVDVPFFDFPLLLVLAVMVVLPYVTKGVLFLLIIGTVSLAALVTPSALLLDQFNLIPFSLNGEVVPRWLLLAIIFSIIPAVIGLILLLTWQYGSHLSEALLRTQETNEALRASERELGIKVQELQESRNRIVSAQESVRREIAGHLHGAVQGRLLVLKGCLQQLLEEIRHLPETAQTLSGLIDDMGKVIQEELSDLSRRLYPYTIRLGLAPSLRSLVGQFQRSVAIEIDLADGLIMEERANPGFIPQTVRLEAYRITEEALTNVIKHARANRVKLAVSVSPDRYLHLSVKDNGQGFTVEEAFGGLGTSTIQDYAGAVGGSCLIRSSPGQGTEVTALLPLGGFDTGQPPRAAPWG